MVQANVTPTVSMDLNVPGRVAAKMAFNAATQILGAGIMLSRAFDGVRSYILGEDVEGGAVELPNGKKGMHLDLRLVDNWIRNTKLTDLGVDTSAHSIRFLAELGMLVARVDLFGGLECHNVRLGLLSQEVRGLPTTFTLRGGVETWLPPLGSGSD